MKIAAFRALSAAAALAALTLSAHASTTTLTFSEASGNYANLSYASTVGGALTITPNKGSLVINQGLLGGTSTGHSAGSLGPSETITFTFSQTVQLSFWDMEDLDTTGSNQFGLKVDGGANTSYSLASNGAATVLSGKTFTFSHKGEAYFIDTLKFSSVSPVPEASSTGMVLAGLGVVGFLVGRRRG